MTNGNQGASGGETVNVCTAEDLAEHTATAQTYEFQREYTASKVIKRIFVELPTELGGTIEWKNPYLEVGIQERNISLATMLDGIGRAVREDIDPLWTGEMGREDQEMVLAARRSIGMDRRPVALPLPPDPSEEKAFDRIFEERFGVHPREDLDAALAVNFKAR